MASNQSWPTYAGSTNRWLDPQTVAAISEELPALANEIVTAIQREVPDYARPLRGAFGHGIRSGTEVALRRFIGASEHESPAVYRQLGYGEHRAGRSLDALQSAYRVGARVAWRRMSRAAARAGASPDAQSRLAEAMFAYLDQLAAESVEGYAEAQLDGAGELERRRGTLVSALLGDPAPESGTLAQAAAEARWPLPARLACLVVAGGDGDGARVGRRLSGETLHGEIGGTTCVLVPDPVRLEKEADAVAERLDLAIALGPSVAPADALASLRLARLAGQLTSGRGALVVAEERLADIALLAARDVIGTLRQRTLAPLRGESERSRARLEQTLLAWLRHRGSQKAVAAELGVHPQTVRYRMRRLRELLGRALEDPERRFELELALRARTPEPAPDDPLAKRSVGLLAGQ